MRFTDASSRISQKWQDGGQFVADVVYKNNRVYQADGAALSKDEVGAHKMPEEMDAKLSEKARENLMRWYQMDLEIYDYCKAMHQQFVEKLGESCASSESRQLGEAAA